MNVQLYCGDCLSVMGGIPDASVNLILTDLPYGVTQCRWDQIIPLEPLWVQYKRIIKPRGAVVLTSIQPFTSVLIISNQNWFKYCLVWRKTHPSDIFNAKHKPLRYHEDICVFSDGTTANGSSRRMTYNPQGLGPGIHRYKQRVRINGIYKTRKSHGSVYANSASHYPGSVLDFPSEYNRIHPTQKPIALMEYLIKTYTNEGETVLDSCMGSGTTLVACLNTNRHGIGIEKDPEIFATAENRIAAELDKTSLLTGSLSTD